MKKVYIIGIGGIGISGIAWYYHSLGYKVYGSDTTFSHLIKSLQGAGIDIFIGVDEERIDTSFEKVIYTESIPSSQKELLKAKSLSIPTLSYPEALGEIFNTKVGVAIAGSHGKSTTTALTSLVLKNSQHDVNALVGSLLKEFDGKNVHFSQSPYFVIEACEYKRSFLHYKPYIGVITNIDLDHIDYYKDLDDYISAFKEFIDNITPRGYIIINHDDTHSQTLFKNRREDISYILVSQKSFCIYPPLTGEQKTSNLISGYQKQESVDLYSEYREIIFPKMSLQVPGDHILFDAKLAYTIGYILDIASKNMIDTLQSYTGIWRRSELIGLTLNNNILMSDYGHHPTEILLNLHALSQAHPHKKLIVFFQPHQYSRTIELLDGFVSAFKDADTLIIPDIYEARDTLEDKKRMNVEILLSHIDHPNKQNGYGLQNSTQILLELDEKYLGECVFLLLGAGTIDTIRDNIPMK